MQNEEKKQHAVLPANAPTANQRNLALTYMN